MKKIILIIAVLLSCASCKKNSGESNGQNPEPKEAIAFDAKKWQIKDDKGYPYRSDMVDGLLAADTLKKLNKSGILQLLGEPDRIDNNHFFYQINQTRIGSWPLKTKTLVIKMKDKETVEWVKIHG